MVGKNYKMKEVWMEKRQNVIADLNTNYSISKWQLGQE